MNVMQDTTKGTCTKNLPPHNSQKTYKIKNYRSQNFEGMYST